MKCDLNWKDKSKGVYVIKNLINNNIYIGRSTGTLYNRFKTHYSTLMNNKSGHQALQRAVNKYGIANFSFEILMISSDDNYIMSIESLLIKLFKPEYNCSIPDDFGREAPNKNKKFDPNWKYKLGSVMRGKKHSVETLNKITESNKNNASKIKLYDDTQELFFNSLVEIANYFNVKRVNLSQCKTYKGFKIEYIKTQNIKVEIDNGVQKLEFNSMGEVDKFLNMYRGATSVYYQKNEKIKGYSIKKIE